MPLTHVSHWTKNGWKSIPAEEAARIHPARGGVSARSGLFRCDLCGQYVTLTKEGIYSSHFRHTNDLLSQNCPDKTDGYGTSYSFQVNDYSLPIRIQGITANYFELEIGFIPTFETSELIHSSAQIKISASNWSSDSLFFNCSRLMSDNTTYLSVGNHIAEKYRISIFDREKELSCPWHSSIDGISSKGTLFDSVTRKKIPADADVQVNHKYYLLTQQKLKYNSDIQYEKTSSHQFWIIYEITATSFSENAARFFMNYQCRLTEQPATLFPLWPVYVDKPYVILHHQERMIMYLQGERVEPKVFPAANLRYLSEKENNAIVFRLACNERQQLLSSGRTKVLKYTYLWKDELLSKTDLPSIQVTDLSGNPIDAGSMNTLPQQNLLQVTAPYDGVIITKRNNIIIDKQEIKANEKTDIYIQYGLHIEVFQGLEVV